LYVVAGILSASYGHQCEIGSALLPVFSLAACGVALSKQLLAMLEMSCFRINARRVDARIFLQHPGTYQTRPPLRRVYLGPRKH